MAYIIPNEGEQYMLSAAFCTGAAVHTTRLILYSGNPTLTGTMMASSLTAVSAGGISSYIIPLSNSSFIPVYINRRPISHMDPYVYMGIGIFLIGESLNFAHHKILAGLRTKSEYVIPRSGLFDQGRLPALPVRNHFLVRDVPYLPPSFHGSVLFFDGDLPRRP